jgi:CRP-like cAMP-binding protein/uncharacterized membrane protein YgcG
MDSGGSLARLQTARQSGISISTSSPPARIGRGASKDCAVGLQRRATLASCARPSDHELHLGAIAAARAAYQSGGAALEPVASPLTAHAPHGPATLRRRTSLPAPPGAAARPLQAAAPAAIPGGSSARVSVLPLPPCGVQGVAVGGRKIDPIVPRARRLILAGAEPALRLHGSASAPPLGRRRASAAAREATGAETAGALDASLELRALHQSCSPSRPGSSAPHSPGGGSAIGLRARHTAVSSEAVVEILHAQPEGVGAQLVRRRTLGGGCTQSAAAAIERLLRPVQLSEEWIPPPRPPSPPLAQQPLAHAAHAPPVVTINAVAAGVGAEDADDTETTSTERGAPGGSKAMRWMAQPLATLVSTLGSQGGSRRASAAGPGDEAELSSARSSCAEDGSLGDSASPSGTITRRSGGGGGGGGGGSSLSALRGLLSGVRRVSNPPQTVGGTRSARSSASSAALPSAVERAAAVASAVAASQPAHASAGWGEAQLERGAQLLAAHPHFGEMSAPDLAAVARGARTRELGAEQWLCREGEACGAVFVLLEGSLHVWHALGPAAGASARPGDVLCLDSISVDMCASAAATQQQLRDAASHAGHRMPSADGADVSARSRREARRAADGGAEPRPCMLTARAVERCSVLLLEPSRLLRVAGAEQAVVRANRQLALMLIERLGAVEAATARALERAAEAAGAPAAGLARSLFSQLSDAQRGAMAEAIEFECAAAGAVVVAGGRAASGPERLLALANGEIAIAHASARGARGDAEPDDDETTPELAPDEPPPVTGGAHAGGAPLPMGTLGASASLEEGVAFFGERSLLPLLPAQLRASVLRGTGAGSSGGSMRGGHGGGAAASAGVAASLAGPMGMLPNLVLLASTRCYMASLLPAELQALCEAVPDLSDRLAVSLALRRQAEALALAQARALPAAAAAGAADSDSLPRTLLESLDAAGKFRPPLPNDERARAARSSTAYVDEVAVVLD